MPHETAYRTLSAVAAERSDLLAPSQADQNRPALLALAAQPRDWLRSPATWEPPDDPTRQLGSLARHLVAIYDVPHFFDGAWRAGLSHNGTTWQGWFRRLATGRNLRDAVGLPIPLSRRETGFVLQSPDDLTIPQALRFGQVCAAGGEPALARSLAQTRLSADFAHHEFWASVIRWFVAHPEVDPADHRAIVDYLHHEKFVPQVANPRAGLVADGVAEPQLIPPQPDLSVKGRTPAALIRVATRWRAEFNRRPVAAPNWRISALPPLSLRLKIGDRPYHYATRQLIGEDELIVEGSTMHHCVASYAHHCRTGQCSIWSLSGTDAGGFSWRSLTLQVSGDQPGIVQAKGAHNRPASLTELAILDHWAKLGGPALGSQVRIPLDLWENRGAVAQVHGWLAIIPTAEATNL